MLVTKEMRNELVNVVKGFDFGKNADKVIDATIKCVEYIVEEIESLRSTSDVEFIKDYAENTIYIATGRIIFDVEIEADTLEEKWAIKEQLEKYEKQLREELLEEINK